MAGILTDPPMIPTDLPTAEQFFQGGTTHRYSTGILNNGINSLIDVGLIPNGFGIGGYAKGLVVAYLTQGYLPTVLGDQGAATLRVALHRPGAKLSDYQTHWLGVPDIAFSDGAGNFSEGNTAAKIACQRQGEFIYVFGHTGVDFSENFFLWKITRSEYTQVAFSENFFLSDFSPTLHIGQPGGASPNAGVFVSDDEVPFIWHTYGFAGYADELGFDQSAGWALGFTEDGTPLGTERYAGDVFDEGTSYYAGPGTGWNFTGKTGGFKQKVFIPKGQYGRGPTIAFPWRCGSYGAPELWFLLVEFDSAGLTTGRFHIYRSTWGRGNYVRYDNPAPTKPLGYVSTIYPGVAVDPTTFNYHPDHERTVAEQPIVLADDAAFMSHGTLFPKTNPNGYAFQTKWFTKANYVGTVGPFDGGVYNPRSTPAAAAQNASNSYIGGTGGQGGFSPLSHTSMSIRVLRDTKHRDTLHLVVADGGQHPQVYVNPITGYNGVWHMTSGDDGRTWTTPAQMIPGPHGSEEHVEKGLLASGAVTPPLLAAVRTFDDATLVNVGYRKDYTKLDESTAPLQSDQGMHAAFVALDYLYTGIAGGKNQHPVIFRRGEAHGKMWQ